MGSGGGCGQGARRVCGGVEEGTDGTFLCTDFLARPRKIQTNGHFFKIGEKGGISDRNGHYIQSAKNIGDFSKKRDSLTKKLYR